MHRETLLRWSIANILSRRRYDMLVQRYQNLDSALNALSESLLQELGCREKIIPEVLKRVRTFDPTAYEKALETKGFQLISIEDAAYPEALCTVADAPVFLYYWGSLECLKHPCIALVGTRDMSVYGRRVVGEFINGLVPSGITTVSGLAHGIDAEVARDTIASGGKTVAVLGHGGGMMYPKEHAALAESIVKAGGLVLTEFPLDVRPDLYTFPARNRIIAGLALATVVVEAAKESGSLITAELALDYNRDVYAVPGQIFDANYSGCHELITGGRAKLLSSADEVLRDIGVLPVGEVSSPYTGENPEEEVLLASLTRMPKTMDDLVADAKLDISSAAATLTILEMKGVIENVGESRWVRK